MFRLDIRVTVYLVEQLDDLVGKARVVVDHAVEGGLKLLAELLQAGLWPTQRAIADHGCIFS